MFWSASSFGLLQDGASDDPPAIDYDGLEDRIRNHLDPSVDPDCPDEYVQKNCIQCIHFAKISTMKGLFDQSENKEDLESRKKDHVFRWLAKSLGFVFVLCTV